MAFFRQDTEANLKAWQKWKEGALSQRRCKLGHLREKEAGTCTAKWRGLVNLSPEVWGGVTHHLPDMRVGKEQSVVCDET